MKTTIKLICGLMTIVLAACTNNELQQVEQLQNPDGGRVVSVKAYTPGEQADSRLAITEQNASLVMKWTEGDAFWVTINEEQVFFTYDAAKEAFTATLAEGAELENGLAAYYPADGSSLSVQSGKLDGKATFMQGTYSAATNSFTFRHTTAVLKASFSGVPTDAEISSVRVGFGQTAINIPYTDGLDLADGVYIYLPAQNNQHIAQGQEMEFAAVTAEGYIYAATQTIQKAEGIEAGKFYTAGITLTKKIPYVTFTAASAGQKLSYSGTDLQYSTDGDNWSYLAANTPVEFGADNKLYLRGENNTDGTVAGSVYDEYSTISFEVDDIEVACTGDIRTLLDYDNYATVSTSGARFCYLFQDCTSLTTAPELPAENLAEFCYRGMFQGCSSLTTAPVLPAASVVQDCYKSMFQGCSSLTTAPVLPAASVIKECYNSMFKDCSSLSSVTMLAIEVEASSAMRNWLDNVAATGTLYVEESKVNDFNSNRNYYNIPDGWTIEAYTSQP